MSGSSEERYTLTLLSEALRPWRALCLVTLPCLFVLSSAAAENASSPFTLLPIEISDSNAVITFEVDSTWHPIEGTTRGAAGRVWLERAGDPGSLRAFVSLPVALFRTGLQMRDKELRDVMAADRHKEVTLQVEGLEHSCPASFRPTARCSGEASGRITIRDITAELRVPLEIAAVADGFVVTGSFPVRWQDFRVADKSMLLAKLDKTVTVNYTGRLTEDR